MTLFQCLISLIIIYFNSFYFFIHFYATKIHDVEKDTEWRWNRKMKIEINTTIILIAHCSLLKKWKSIKNQNRNFFEIICFWFVNKWRKLVKNQNYQEFRNWYLCKKYYYNKLLLWKYKCENIKKKFDVAKKWSEIELNFNLLNLIAKMCNGCQILLLSENQRMTLARISNNVTRHLVVSDRRSSNSNLKFRSWILFANWRTYIMKTKNMKVF